MVDDIISASKCGPTTEALNAAVNSFVERKKLKLSSEKCARIHIGNKPKCHQCPTLKVHRDNMKNSDKKKYLRDFDTKSANSNETIEARKIRAYTILSEIRAILSEIPLGKWRLEMGLALRDAWFLNGIIFNSEVWNAYAEKHIEEVLKKEEVVRKLYSAMKNKPLKGDWYNLIQSDFERIGMILNEKASKKQTLLLLRTILRKVFGLYGLRSSKKRN